MCDECLIPDNTEFLSSDTRHFFVYELLVVCFCRLRLKEFNSSAGRPVQCIVEFDVGCLHKNRTSSQVWRIAGGRAALRIDFDISPPSG